MFYEVFNIKISEISLLKVLQKEKKTTIKKKKPNKTPPIQLLAESGRHATIYWFSYLTANSRLWVESLRNS